MYYYPYQFEFQPQVHLRTDYPPHQSYPHLQYQDQQTQQQEIQIHGQNQPRGTQQNLYHLVSTPNTPIDTPTSGHMTCPTVVPSSGMAYFPSPQQELVFTDPLVRPRNSDTPEPSANDLDSATPTERHYSCDYECEWRTEQSMEPSHTQPQQQHPESYPFQLQQQQQPLLTYSPLQSIPSPSKLHTRLLPPQPQLQPQLQHATRESLSPINIPPPRLTRPVRREREQPFKAFHPYANARPSGSGEKEKEKANEECSIDTDEKPSATTALPTSSPSISLSTSPPVSATPAPVPPPVPSPTKTQTRKSGKTLISITIPDPAPAHIATPTPIFSHFSSYPLSRGQALPGPTCAPETSSSVMRLVLAPGALTPHGVALGNGHTGKKEKTEKNVAAIAAAASDPSTAVLTSVNVGAIMTPALPSGSAAPISSNSAAPFMVGTHSAQNAVGAAASSNALSNFSTATAGLSAAATSANANTMAIRKPRMACYFCRKRKIACGPGPEAIALAQKVQAEAQAQQQRSATMTPNTTLVEQEHQGQQNGGLFEPASTESTDHKTPSTSPTSLLSPISSPPVISTLTPAQMLPSPPPLQTLTGDEGPCNQCARRGLACERPTESKRGVRKGKSKKEKEREAKEKEAKERELKKSGDPGKINKDGDKDQSDDEDSIDGEVNDDDDLDGFGEVDLGDGDDGEGETRCFETVSSATTSVDAISLPSLPSPIAPKAGSRPSASSSNTTPKPISRGRGRPPKHLAASNSNPASNPASGANSGPKGWMKGMTGSFKWTASSTGNKSKTQAKGKGKGKGKGKKKGQLEVAVEVSLADAGVPVKSEEHSHCDLRVEDMQVDVIEEQPLYDDERLAYAESDDDIGGEDKFVDETRDYDHETRSPVDVDDSDRNSSIPIAALNSDIQTHTEVQHPLSSLTGESSLSPTISVDSSDLNGAMSLPTSDAYSTPVPVQVTEPYPDSYPYYTHAHTHVHSPIAEQHPQHPYPVADRTMESPDNAHPTDNSYTNANVTMLQEENDDAYHNSQAPPPVFNSHDDVYAMEYSSHSQVHVSMPVEHADIMQPYYDDATIPSVVDSYSMNIEYDTEMRAFDMTQQQPMALNAETYDVHVNGYPIDSMSAVEYDQHVQVQGYVNAAISTGYEPYGYDYGYNGAYTL